MATPPHLSRISSKLSRHPTTANQGEHHQHIEGKAKSLNQDAQHFPQYQGAYEAWTLNAEGLVPHLAVGPVGNMS